MALPVTTVVPFTALPSCATLCGPLYDANGACVPPAAPSSDAATYDSCFCAYGSLQPFKSGTSGVCDNACQANAQGLSSIQSWFTSFCNDKAITTSTATSSSASSSSTGSSGNSGSSGSTGGGDWLSTHWKWVIMIVIIVVGIVGIWVGACIWRRRYLKKKDRMYELGKGLPSNIAVNTQGNLVGAGVRSSQASGPPGSFMPGPAPGAYGEKPKKERKRWNVQERT